MTYESCFRPVQVVRVAEAFAGDQEDAFDLSTELLR